MSAALNLIVNHWTLIRVIESLEKFSEIVHQTFNFINELTK